MKRWPEIRAGLILTAIGFGLVDGLPIPPPGEPYQDMALHALVPPARAVQRVLEWPVAWIRPTLQITQRWALYQAPDRERYRMSIEGQLADETWQILYRAADPDHTEDAAAIEHARVWGAWDPLDRLPVQYTPFGAWISARVLDRHPELVAARMRMEKIVLFPGGYISTGQFGGTYQRVRK